MAIDDKAVSAGVPFFFPVTNYFYSNLTFIVLDSLSLACIFLEMIASRGPRTSLTQGLDKEVFVPYLSLLLEGNGVDLSEAGADH